MSNFGSGALLGDMVVQVRDNEIISMVQEKGISLFTLISNKTEKVNGGDISISKGNLEKADDGTINFIYEDSVVCYKRFTDIDPPAVNISLHRVNNGESVTIFEVVISSDSDAKGIYSINFKGNDAESPSKRSMVFSSGNLFIIGFSNLIREGSDLKGCLSEWLDSNCEKIDSVVQHACGDKAPAPLARKMTPSDGQ